MIRIAICDDSAVFLEQAKFMLEHWDKSPVKLIIDAFEDADELISTHNEKPFDIILLDVVMPLWGGIEAAKEIRKNDRKVKLVFLTSSAEYAVDSYTVKADNYLLKPVAPEVLFSALEELIAELLKTSRHIVIKTNDAMHRILVSDIEYIEAQNKHVLFVFSNGKELLSTEPLYSFEDKLTLDEGFFKCHRSYIANINYISTYSQKDITMHSGARLPISRSYQKDFSQAFFQVILGKDSDD